MKKILLLLVLLISGIVFSQEKTVNDYKYLIVPEKFEWLKEPNKYNLNDLTKMLFAKQGFEVYFPSEKMPDELALDKCKALYGTLENESGLMNTSVFITIRDCNGKVLFKSEKGKSKLKDFKKAYYEALRDAAVSFTSLNYHYDATVANQAKGIKPSPVQNAEPETIAPQNTPQAIPVANENQLFAQPVANGYQLVDTTPKVVLRMYKTSQPDSYTAQGEGKNGVVFKKGNEWFFEYYQNDKLVSEKLNIKF